MPVSPLIPALIGSIVGNAADEIAALPPQGSAGSPAVMMAPPRLLPPGTLKGQLMVRGPMSAEIDGKAMMLAPGVQIRDPLNMMVLPGMIQRPVPVRYLLDPAGSVHRVWILSAQEAAQP